jgi:ABC-type sulfate/molybdate transport systems ATPase subunit/ABC-type sulfate transport system permease component
VGEGRAVRGERVSRAKGRVVFASGTGLPGPLLLAAALMLGYMSVPFLALVGALPGADTSALFAPTTLDALRVSVIAATAATVADGLLGVPLGYWLATSHSRLRHLVTAGVVLPLAIPPVVGGLELILVIGRSSWLGSLLDRHGLSPLDTVGGAILAQMLVAAPFVVISARAAFAGIDPALVDASWSLGCGPTETFFRVQLPTARRGIAAGLVLGWVRCLGEFGATATLAYHPYTLPTLTFVNLSGEGVPRAIPPAVLAALIGALAGAVVLWLDARTQPPRIDRAEPDVAAEIDELPWMAEARDTSPWVEVDIVAQVGPFVISPRMHSRLGVVAILGPSGSGKSLTMRAIAGLLPARGRIRMGDLVMIDTARGVSLAAQERQLGYVAQRDALFEHLDVAGNVAFGIRRLPDDERRRRVEQSLAVVGLRHLKHARVSQLSGGERQRVALARALAPGPRALLLDEPFSSLDLVVRSQLRDLVRRLHERTGIPVILVTHDREDALDLADYVVVLRQGSVVQAGPLDDVFTRPSNRAVAQLVGLPNVLTVRGLVVSPPAGDAVATDWGTLPVSLDGRRSETWDVIVPREAVRLDPGGVPALVEVSRRSLQGWTLRLRPLEGGEPLETVISPDSGGQLPAGSQVHVRIDPRHCQLVPGPGASPPRASGRDHGETTVTGQPRVPAGDRGGKARGPGRPGR